MELQVQRVDPRGGPGGGGRHGRRITRSVTVVVCALLGVTGGTGVAQASSAGTAKEPQRQVVVTHQTFRLGDGDNQLLVFANKSRAELCTPERIAFENALEAWFEGGQVGEPPVEPADSNAGVQEVTVTTTTTTKPQRTTTTVEGDDLPVEVWRFDNEPGGIDCTATDGPGAERFATGAMDFDVRTVQTPSRFTNDILLAGTVRDEGGARWSYSIGYITRVVGDQEPSFTAHIRLKPKR